ncbi:MAG TPA: decaprenyl-phosphate phosphoribosyltransferase [Ilumatobacteraceae bacterium]|jgi:decaprenyl-phosphate phosphoribosyltransferase|nr:decaprenyl-phosphate phosphoribosyltransferase [Ilumatobacteraceae bacterium]
MTAALLRQARPKQWVKNLLVFAAPGAAGVLNEWPSLWRSMVIFIAFCLASSGTYFWNDLFDVESDRNHPTKQYRPIASGQIPVGVARLVGSLLLVAGIGLAATTRWQAAIVVLAYVVLTTLYSVVLKHIAVVDLIAVAAGFVLRAVGGAVATDVEMSKWFSLTISFASLFIVAGKRYAELRDLGEDAQTRATLDDYSLGFLRIVLSVSCASALVTYCIWAFDTRELSTSTWPFYELSIIPMATALLRYTLILEQGHGAAPEEIFAHDRVLQILGAIWLVTFGLGVYLA